MKTIGLLVCGLMWLGAGAPAGAAPGASAPQGNRYLLVVETSKAMKPLLPAVLQCVQTLLTEKMSGQLQRGDTLGLWTYNDTLHAGDFPMQVWSAETATALAQRVDVFLGKQKTAGGARLQTVVSNLAPVIADSERLTILIFSDGSELIAGTPFDAVINRVFTRHREELRRAQVPFLTVLQAAGGKIIHCTVNAANGPIKLPEFSKPPAPAAPPKPAPPVVVVVKTNPPLIINHSKPVTNIAPTASNLMVLPRPPVMATPTATTEVAVVVAPVIVPAITSAVTSVTAPVTTATVVSAIAPAAPSTPTAAVAVVVAPTVPPPVSNPPPVISVPPATNLAARPPETLAPTNIAPPAPAAAAPATLVPGWVWLILAVAVGAGGAVLLGRRRRTTAHTSAITESLDRRKR